ncbi:MAG TPA: carboxypeptidase-like regulatory domain-containing protein, partial [Pyrinomonadaceae bacterium]|nr:carboxypeptidase-like regulatory domain-containing protein [Pyrinomonadaceae bacterium]
KLNVITNNIIGLNQTGTQPIANQNDGVLILGGANSNIIGFSLDVDGNPISGTSNLISGNNSSGIRVSTDASSPETSDLNIVSGNRVGVSFDESIALANAGSGITITDSPQNIVGNSDILPANIVSGNAQNGILIEGAGAFENLVISNHVGITTEGNALANGLAGLLVSGAPGTVLTNNNVGGNLADGIVAENLALSFSPERKTRTLPAGNDKISKYIRNAFANRGGGSYSLEISGNRIGVFGETNVPNANNGIKFNNVQNALIGGVAPTAGNMIRNNGGAGVRLDETNGNENLINHNSILGNTGLGIDLGTIGNTPNDIGDADEGANRGQNFPEIVSKQIVNDELIINFKIESAPVNSNYGAQGLYVEFFKSDNSGEGERFLGFTHYIVADYNGGFAGTKTVNLGNINVLGINQNDPITATATDADGNTSEFFSPFAPSAAEVSVSGQIIAPNGTVISRATIILTDDGGQTRSVNSNAFGYFKFENVEVGRTYIISVRHKQYVFTQRVLTVNDEISELILSAEQ